jgi:pilus assembly protein CpaE
VILSPTGSELVLRMLDVVSFQNDHTVLDVPYYETAWKDELLSAVNSVYIVTELTIPSLRQAKELFTRIKQLRGNDFTINIVANKHRKRFFGLGVGKKEAQRVFRQTATTVLDEDWNTMNDAINRGLLPAEVNPRSDFARQMGKLAEAVQ